jgi:hypothetical protein
MNLTRSPMSLFFNQVIEEPITIKPIMMNENFRTPDRHKQRRTYRFEQSGDLFGNNRNKLYLAELITPL